MREREVDKKRRHKGKKSIEYHMLYSEVIYGNDKGAARETQREG
jgi:hypothetical protein